MDVGDTILENQLDTHIRVYSTGQIMSKRSFKKKK